MKCPCCGYEPEEEPEPLWPDLDIKPGDVFIPRVVVVGGANINALIDRRVTLDFNTGEYRDLDSLTDEEWTQLCQAQRDRESIADPNRKGGSW